MALNKCRVPGEAPLRHKEKARGDRTKGGSAKAFALAGLALGAAGGGWLMDKVQGREACALLLLHLLHLLLLVPLVNVQVLVVHGRGAGGVDGLRGYVWAP